MPKSKQYVQVETETEDESILRHARRVVYEYIQTLEKGSPEWDKAEGFYWYLAGKGPGQWHPVGSDHGCL